MTGERIGDEYFTKLYNLRNDEAKMKRNSSSFATSASSASLKHSAVQSNDGCESVSNDKRSGYASDDGCESLTNTTSVAVR